VSGSWVTVKGVNLSKTTRAWSGADIVNGNLPTSLDGVSVKINGQPAFVYYISSTQINVQAPAGLPSAWVTVEVINNGVSTGPVLTHAVQNSPGAFVYPVGDGRLFAVATEPDGTVIGDASAVAGVRSAAPGDTIVIYASGLAPSPAGTATPAPPALSLVQVTIGGKAADLKFAGLISPGLFQINVVVPSVPDGDQPLVININGAKSPGNVVLTVHQ